ncbi:hypothetical protein C2R22_17880 [Salinigranum rubrum]|uniref:DUF4352 domain-containing protein n=1 Tax=Salinigranum rubrum TaxID=755307 RepID=A0A2I8VMX2_9EURY|nr:hypothetical protein [Salinigranum rubrum]AUV83282.1 hypothetical protein C2R22_17880 [Salinigranum rubrum]
MHRRAVLALCGAGLSGLAGCSSEQRGGEPADDTSASPTAASTATATATPPETELRVELDALQPALVELDVDYYRLVAEDDRQYLVLAVDAISGPPPSRSALVFRFDGTDHTPRTWERIPARQSDRSGSEQYSSENGAGWVAFDLPETGDASDAALVWPGGEWRPDDGLRRRLTAPLPSLSLVEWRGPETVPLDGTTTFELTVRNEGDETGRFVGAINGEGWYPHRPVTRLSRRVSPGETATWEVTGEEIDLPEADWSERVGDEESDLQYELIWPGGNEWKSIRIVDE